MVKRSSGQRDAFSYGAIACMETDFTSRDDLDIAKLFSDYEQRLWRYATGLTGDSDRADDLVQETFIRAMAHINTLNRLNRHQRQAWLYKVLKNLYLDQQRKRQRMQTMFNQLAQIASQDTFPVVDATFYGLFDRIPARYRSLLEKRYILGMTSTEIGRDLGIPAATVRSRLRLAIQWLRENLSEYI